MQRLLQKLAVVAFVSQVLAGCGGGNSSQPTTVLPTQSQDRVAAAKTSTGNGAPSGSHYELNIIGVSKAKTADMSGADGHTIFVDLGTTSVSKQSEIDLQPGPFEVVNANGTGGNAALFQLPDPTTTTYTIWARALGTPAGFATQSTCATDQFGVVICNTGLTFSRPKGQSTFSNVTSQLTTITISQALATSIGCPTTVSLFNPCLQGYFWQYDNSGLKLLQVRFYY